MVLVHPWGNINEQSDALVPKAKSLLGGTSRKSVCPCAAPAPSGSELSAGYGTGKLCTAWIHELSGPYKPNKKE